MAGAIFKAASVPHSGADSSGQADHIDLVNVFGIVPCLAGSRETAGKCRP